MTEPSDLFIATALAIRDGDDDEGGALRYPAAPNKGTSWGGDRKISSWAYLLLGASAPKLVNECDLGGHRPRLPPQLPLLPHLPGKPPPLNDNGDDGGT